MADAIVVFGCAVDDRGHPSPALLRRLRGVLEAARAYPEAAILVSGAAQPGRPPEASGMAAWLLAHAVPDSRILRESAARNTRENAVYCAQRLRPLQPAQVLLVTERYHMRRSAMLLRRALRRLELGAAVLPQPVPDELEGAAQQLKMGLEGAKLARDWLIGWPQATRP